MSNQSLRTAVVNYSITNPDITNENFRDNVTPFSFLDFINYTQADYDPEEYSSFYSSYLQRWHAKQGNSEAEQKRQFKEYYQQFIKEIVISYTTESEKRFLEKIDFTDPADLDIAIPFFANRLKDIALFYKKKRDEGKYVIERNKLKGSTTGVEKAIFDNIYNFLFTADDSLNAQTSNLPEQLNNLGIEIEEFVDVYGDYFDAPTDAVSDNVNDIDTKYYLDASGIEAISSERNFLGAIRTFKINAPKITPAEFDAICDPDNDLVQLVNQYTKGGIPINDFYALKRALIRKFLGTDIYYVDNTTSPATSGLLLTAENPTGNALNLQDPDTASVESGDVKLLRDIGINFKPDQIGLFKLQTDNFSYSIDTSVLGDEFVIFPDPAKFGNVSTTPQSAYPVYYKFDYRKNTRNVSSGKAAGDPKITNKATTFESYTTKERNNSQLKEHNDISYKLNFTDLYNQGSIDKYQTDVFGNEYALFKEDALQDRAEVADTNKIKNLLLDGHVFFDDLEGYSFNYDLTGSIGNAIRSGLSARTNGFPPLLGALTLYMREFYPYQELLEDTRTIKPFWRDGGAFTFLDGDELPNPLTGIGPGFPATENYHYTVLAEGTFPEEQFLTTDQTPLSSITTEDEFLLHTGISLNFTQDIRHYLSAGDPYMNYNGGYFTDEIELPNDFIYADDYRYIDKVDLRGSTILSNLTASNDTLTKEERKTLAGKLYVKNGTYSTSEPLSAALNGILSKYSSAVQSDVINSLKDFDVIQNTLFLQTSGSLVIDKIEHEDGIFLRPSTVNTIYNIDGVDGIEKFTNRFYIESLNKVYFARFRSSTGTTCTITSPNYQSIYPEIYEYDVSTNRTEKVYPPATDSLSAFNTNSSTNTNTNFSVTEVHTPQLVYNKRNNLFKLTYILNDLNDMTHLMDATFKIAGNALELVSVVNYDTDSITSRSSTFADDTTFATISAGAGSFTQDTQTFTLTI
jgi:hypothetical protein